MNTRAMLEGTKMFIVIKVDVVEYTMVEDYLKKLFIKLVI